jgi:hypothetical protein
MVIRETTSGLNHRFGARADILPEEADGEKNLVFAEFCCNFGSGLLGPEL